MPKDEKNEKNTTCGSHKKRLELKTLIFFSDFWHPQVGPKRDLLHHHFFFLAHFRLPQVGFWENKKIQVVSEFGRDHVARGSSAPLRRRVPIKAGRREGRMRVRAPERLKGGKEQEGVRPGETGVGRMPSRRERKVYYKTTANR